MGIELLLHDGVADAADLLTVAKDARSHLLQLFAFRSGHTVLGELVRHVSLGESIQLFTLGLQSVLLDHALFQQLALESIGIFAVALLDLLGGDRRLARFPDPALQEAVR